MGARRQIANSRLGSGKYLARFRGLSHFKRFPFPSVRPCLRRPNRTLLYPVGPVRITPCLVLVDSPFDDSLRMKRID